MLIRKALMELLRQKPIQAISIKELCESAGINRGTFYAHYTDMYDLLQKIESDMLQDFQEALKPLLAPNRSDLTPVKITAAIFRCLKDNADLCTVTLGDYGDKSFALQLINLGREKCMEAYSKFFTDATPKEIEFFYAFVSAGCIAFAEMAGGGYGHQRGGDRRHGRKYHAPRHGLFGVQEAVRRRFSLPLRLLKY